MRRLVTASSVLAALLAVLPAVHAANGPQVEVTAPRIDQFLDAGDGPREAQGSVALLSRHLQALGREGLSADRRLRIEITELDLAGRLLPALRHPQRLRVLDGAADWPRIDLRYELRGPDDALLDQGETSLSDKTYLLHPIAATGAEPLRYERRLLTQWFRGRFGAREGAPAAAVTASRP